MVKKDNIEANKDVLRTSQEGYFDVDELRAVPHVLPQQLRQILGQATGGRTDGADNGPEGGGTLNGNLRQPVKYKASSTLATAVE
jgi:hypothetical protein